MRNLLLGGVMTIAGALLTGPILIAAAISATTLGSWNGHKWMYAIYQANPVGFGTFIIGGLFVVGLLLLLMGIIILFREWYADWLKAMDAKEFPSAVSEDNK